MQDRIVIMNSLTGKILGCVPFEYDPKTLTNLRDRINAEYDFSYSLIFSNAYDSLGA
jgi:hypothetical protein